MIYKKHYSKIVFLTYVLISVIFTFPLILKMSGFLIGRPLDGFLHIWNVDSFWTQILNFHSPFFTNRIFFPIGANLALNTSAPLISLFGLPFLNNISLYINLLILSSFTFSAFFTFKLIKRITNNELAGFVSGLFYGFSPIMFSYVITQHYYFIYASVFIPIGIYFCEEFIEKLKPIDLTMILLFFWVIFLIDYYTSILYLVICLLYIIFRVILLNKVKTFLHTNRLLYYIAVLTCVFVLPLFIFYLLVFSGSNLKTFSLSENRYPYLCSARIADFVTPSELNPLLKNYSKIFRNTFNNPESGDTPYLFLGWISVFLASISIFYKKLQPKSLPFLGVGAIVLLLSIGPSTFVFKYFSKLPFMSFIDCPQRFTIGIELALASLIGITFSLIKQKDNIFQRLLLAFFITIFLVEYGTSGLSVTKLEVPTIYSIIARDKNNLTVLELPSGLTESKGAFGYDWSIWGLNSMQMYWQTIYHKPKVGGYVSRIDEKTYSFFRNEPIISDLFSYSSRDGKWTGREFNSFQIEGFISKFNLGYIVLSPNLRQEEFSRVIENIFSNRISKKVNSEGYVLYIIN